MLKVAVTGGLASGKSTVCSFLKELGAYVVSSDEIVHELLSPKTAVGKKVIALLGLSIVKERKIDRKKVAELVFSNSEKLKILEEIIHPAVLEEIEKQYKQIKNSPSVSFFVAEVPLLFELGWQMYFDRVISVSASEALCKARYKKTEEDDFEKRMARQLGNKEKHAQADITIINNGSINELKEQIKQHLTF